MKDSLPPELLPIFNHFSEEEKDYFKSSETIHPSSNLEEIEKNLEIIFNKSLSRSFKSFLLSLWKNPFS
ncbi:MAG: hypothetical protein ACTSP3_10900 [Candidatus Heimdallarchaeaceae archaeon]